MLRLDEGGYNYKGYVIYRDYEDNTYHIRGIEQKFISWLDAEEYIDFIESR